jgi:DNA invertase Pin-like site-specific DNA recombinase
MLIPRDQLKAFAAECGLTIVSWYVENESRAKLARPEPFKLLADAHEADILLVEQVDRLSRLTAADWERLVEHRHDQIPSKKSQTSRLKTPREGRSV